MKLRPLAALALVAVTLGACADAEPPGTSSSPSPSRDTGPSALVLRWGFEGGFTPPEFQLTNLPMFSLYGDGTIVRPGPQIEIYPGPALPALEAVHVDDEGIDAIVEAAFEAGLDTVGDLTDTGSVGIADAPETVFTLRADGIDRTVRVYALNELEGQPPGMPDAEFEARQALLHLVQRLGAPEAWLPEGSVGETTTFRPAGSRVFISKYRGQVDLPQPEIQWPLPTSLTSIGEDLEAGFRCIAVTGSDWADVLEPVARDANQLSPWTSDGRRYALSFRPLLPDERAC